MSIVMLKLKHTIISNHRFDMKLLPLLLILSSCNAGQGVPTAFATIGVFVIGMAAALLFWAGSRKKFNKQ